MVCFALKKESLSSVSVIPRGTVIQERMKRFFQSMRPPPGSVGDIFSPDYGATWGRPEIAITSFGGGVPDGIVADDNWVHLLAEPGVYVRRPVPPVFRAIRRAGETVTLEWAGQGTLQDARQITGPWDSISNAGSPYLLTNGVPQRFFRISLP